MLRRNPGKIDKLKDSTRQLEGKEYIEPVNTKELYQVPGVYTYADVPAGAGPPYRRSGRRPAPTQKLVKG